VVLPNSSIVNANENHNSDLYYACRGGGNNFGIITNFQVKVYPRGEVLGGQVTHNEKYTDQVLAELYELTVKLNADPKMSFSSRFLYNQLEDIFQFRLTQEYDAPIINPPVFDRLNAIPSEANNLKVGLSSVFVAEGASAAGAR